MIDVNRLPSFEIQDADRTTSFLRLAFCGPSGSGKTASFLRVASGLLGYMIEHGHCPPGTDRKIGVVDTERKSARLYQDKMFPDGARVPGFKVIELDSPYTTERYLGAMMSFYRAGFPIIGVDQISHAWAGSGGLLEQKTALAKKESLNDFTAFAEITPMQNEFIEQILSMGAHVICTMRSHQKYVLEQYTNKRGQTVSKPKRVGMAPVQREGIEYEFTVVLDLDVDGNAATVNKDRTDVFGVPGTVVGVLTEEHGRRLAQWLYTGRSIGADANLGTPQERLEAVVTTYMAGFDKATTMPDLAAEFERGWLAIRDFDVGDYAKIIERKRIKENYDKNKARLSTPVAVGAATGAIGDMPLDPLEASLIEDMLKQRSIPLFDFCQAFELVRVAQLPALKVDEAREWIIKQRPAAAA